jgi:hypothetical protein
VGRAALVQGEALMPRYDFRCPRCEAIRENVTTKYRHWPICLACGLDVMEPYWVNAFPNVIDDSCDFTVEHMAAEPIHFTSKQEHRRMCKQLGLRVKDRHVGTQGSDKSPLTRRWF